MGAGIAQVCLQGGVEVVGREVSGELGERGRATIDHYLGRAVDKGRLDAATKDEAMGRLSLTTDLADLAGCDLVIEAADRKSTRLNSSHVEISYAVFCLKKKK